jgi:uncharacterized protein YicC (UPF0701 family)
VSLVKEHFGKDTVLRKELELYKTLYETNGLEDHMCEKLIYEVKRSHGKLDREEIFREQTALINKINKMLSKDVFSNFVPNYKNLATISQILNPEVAVKHRVLLENNLAQHLSSTPASSVEGMAPMDNLVYKTFVKKFNEQYNGKLLEGQERLLGKYIASFHDEGIELKIFLNEELSRLKGSLLGALSNEDIKKDSQLSENAKKVLSLIDGYREQPIDSTMIQQVLKIQSLVQELNS